MASTTAQVENKTMVDGLEEVISGIQPGSLGTGLKTLSLLYRAKQSLPKAAFQRLSRFNNLEDGEELLTKQRRARGLMEAMEKVEVKKIELEDAYEALIEHLH